jgi:hypothetical protein
VGDPRGMQGDEPCRSISSYLLSLLHTNVKTASGHASPAHLLHNTFHNANICLSINACTGHSVNPNVFKGLGQNANLEIFILQPI